MTAKHKRWEQHPGKKVIFVNAADQAFTQARFDRFVAEAQSAGAITAGNFPWAYEALWSKAHYGADEVRVLAADAEIEPVTHWADGRPLAEVEPQAVAAGNGSAASEQG